MLEQARLFYHDLTIIADQLDPFADASQRDTRSGPRDEEMGVDV